jgi:hypothetical protein
MMLCSLARIEGAIVTSMSHRQVEDHSDEPDGRKPRGQECRG